MMRNCGCLVTAIDNVHDYWPNGMANRHYYVMQDNILQSKLKGAAYDLITCISVLEHIREHRQAVRSMIDLLKPGGHLVLSFPYNEHQYVSNVYALPGSVGAGKFPFSTQVYSRTEVTQWCNDSPVRLIEQEYWRFFDGEFWTLGNPVCPPERTGPDDRHQLTCILLRKDPLI
jgi:2-polyprenyl-3-methyl-5-hydroxy-6-metoxy-1,4-benzoquinol methylase